ncbi:MAG: serine hydrolase domain-containing protein [Lacipirellulaceae bacterium]
MNRHNLVDSRNLLLLALLLGCYFKADSASSQEPKRNLTDQWVEQAAKPLIKERKVDGMSIGYLQGKHYGVVHLGAANRSKKKATNTTIYEVGSISKVFTGLLLADAVVRGEIDLQAAAATANAAGVQFPAYEGTPITWTNLATHRSGLPRLPNNFSAFNLQNPYQKYDSRLAAAYLENFELRRKPGESYEYSNFGASVLGYLVAENANSTYEQLLRDRIAKPLKMTDCTTKLSSEQKKRLATPHSRFSGVTPAWHFADLPGAGGVRASIRDMMRFARAQLQPPKGEIGEAIELAWKRHAVGDESGPALGLGWHIMGDGQTRWHNGQTGGSHASLFVNRQTKSAVVILCNTAAGNQIDELAMQMMRKAAGEKVELATAEQASGKAALKTAPFQAIRWQDEQPEVKVKGRWYKLVKLDHLTTEKILAFSRQTYNSKWQKRFEEDLVELLQAMGHAPNRRVTLEVQPLDSAETKTLKRIPMTKANRESIRNAAMDQAKDKPAKEKVDDEKLAADPQHRRRLEGRYQLNPNFIFTIRDRDGRMMVAITNQATQEVFPDSPTRWSYKGIEATLEFELPKQGQATGLILHQNGLKQKARRLR